MTNEQIEKKFLFDLNMDQFKRFPANSVDCYSFRCDRNIFKLMILLDNNDFKCDYVTGIPDTKRDLRDFSKRYIINIFRDSKIYIIGGFSRYLGQYCNEIPNYMKRYDK